MTELIELGAGVTKAAPTVEATSRVTSSLFSSIDPAILSIVPSTLLLGAVPIIWCLHKSTQDVIRPSILLQFKIAFVSLLIGTEAGFFASRLISTNESTHEQQQAALLSLLAACSLGKIVVVQHGQTLSSSPLLTLWLAIAAICDALRAHIFYYRQSSSLLSTIAIVLPVASSAVFKTGLFVLGEFPKHHLIKDTKVRDILPQEKTLGSFSRFILLPIYERLLSKFDKELTMADLPDLDNEFAAERLLEAFNKEWKTTDKHSRYALTKVCATILAPSLVSTALLRLLGTLFRVVLPILIRSIIQYTLGIYMLNTETSTAIALTVAAVGVYGGLGTSQALYTRAMNRTATLLRGTLIAAVYQKAISLVSSDNQQHEALDIINTKVERISRELDVVHNVWAHPLELAACMYVLFTVLGNAAFLVTLPITVTYCIGWYCGGNIATDRIAWHEKIEARVTRVCDMLCEIQAIKSIGLDAVMLKRIREVYRIEMLYFQKFRKWSLVLISSRQLFVLITYPLVFGGSVWLTPWAGRLSTVASLTALAVMTIMFEPLESCLGIWWRFGSVATRVHQIQEYLLREETYSRQLQQSIAYDVGKTVVGTINNAVPVLEPTEGEDIMDRNTVFELRNAAISIQKVPYPVLEQISVVVKPGDLTMIVGRTESGRTSLLRSLTGKARVSAGYRYRAPGYSTAYCGQRAWLRNTSICQNIIAYNAMDAEWYNIVLDICLLKSDLQQLPRADKTIVGIDGNKLSSIQRHKVALARAIYSRSSILLLDDIFSAFDDSTALKIGLQLFNPASMLRRSKTTIITVTHSRQLLRFATRIWLFDMDGRLIEQSGRGDERFRRKFRRVLVHIASDEKEGMIANDSPSEAASKAHRLRFAYAEDIMSSNDRADAKRRFDWRILLLCFKTLPLPKLLFWFGYIALLALSMQLPVLYTHPWLEDQLGTAVWLSGYVWLSVGGAVAGGCSQYMWLIRLLPISHEYFHECILVTAVDATFHYLRSVDMRCIVTLFTRDVFCVADTLGTDFYGVVYYTMNVITQSTIIIYFAEVNGALAMSFIISMFAITQICWTSSSRQLAYFELESRARFRIQLTDTEKGLEHIHAFGWEALDLKFALHLINKSQKPFYYAQDARRWLGIVFDMVIFGAGVLLTMRTVFALHVLSASSLGVSLITMISLASEGPDGVLIWARMQSSLGAIERIDKFSETTPREFGRHIEASPAILRQWPKNGQVVMRNVSAKYDDSNRSPFVLQNISLTIPAKGRLGIIGGSGSGKTSFALSILNLLEHTGDILIDGVNITQVPRSILRSRITTVSQDDIDFDESVRFNLCPWTMSDTESKVHDDSIIQMMKSLELWHLLAMMDGLDTRFRDLRLSIDEKRLMCIARACLRKLHFRSRLVIIDGSTKGLDDEAEELALRAMEVAFWDCTIIEMADHADDLPDSDVILHLDKGRIVKKEFRRTGAPVPMDGPSVLPTMPASI